MPSLNFKKEFVDKIVSGKKRQTIRPKGKRAFSPGDNLYLFTGQRTKHCRKLGTAVCSEIIPFLFEINDIWGPHLSVRFLKDNRENILIMNWHQVTGIARNDGFDGYHDFQVFFIKTYKMNIGDKKRFDLIKWRDFQKA